MSNTGINFYNIQLKESIQFRMKIDTFRLFTLNLICFKILECCIKSFFLCLLFCIAQKLKLQKIFNYWWVNKHSNNDNWRLNCVVVCSVMQINKFFEISFVKLDVWNLYSMDYRVLCLKKKLMSDIYLQTFYIY